MPATRRLKEANDGEGRGGRDRESEKGKRKEAREMECTRARRFFLVRVIGHDVVEINLGARDVLLHDTPSSSLSRFAAKVCYAPAKNETNFAVRIHEGLGHETLIGKGNELIAEVDQRISDVQTFPTEMSRMGILDE